MAKVFGSTAIARVVYHRKDKTADVTFQNGGTYRYEGVTRHQADSVRLGRVQKSSGRSFWDYIAGKPNTRIG